MNRRRFKNYNCTGCAACQAVCPMNAINMEIDEEGFIQPRISETCTECGLCEKICRNRFLAENDRFDNRIYMIL